jgi:hypothetical protein
MVHRCGNSLSADAGSDCWLRAAGAPAAGISIQRCTPLLAFLHDWEIHRLAGQSVVANGAGQHELVVIGVGQVAARPIDLGDAFDYLGIAQADGLA